MLKSDQQFGRFFNSHALITQRPISIRLPMLLHRRVSHTAPLNGPRIVVVQPRAGIAGNRQRVVTETVHVGHPDDN